MDAAFEQRVRERAYEIWMAAGMEDGAADLHWLSAEQSVMTEADKPNAMTKPAAKKSAAKKPVAAKPVVKKAAAPARKLAGSSAVA